MARMDPAGLLATMEAQMKAGHGGLETCACGAGPVMAAMAAARALGATHGTVVSWANSGDVPPNDRGRVVGYGAVSFGGEPAGGSPGGSGSGGGDDASGPAPPPPPAPADADAPLDAGARRALLKLARGTLERWFETGGTVPLPRDLPPAARLPRGAFVTLFEHGELRGCIGHMVPDQPLAAMVQAMALAAAFEDPRFAPVQAGELKDIEIEISVLTPARAGPGPGGHRGGPRRRADPQGRAHRGLPAPGGARPGLGPHRAARAPLPQGGAAPGRLEERRPLLDLPEHPLPRVAGAVTVRLPVLGALALLGQVVLLRECEVASYGSELVLVLGLGVWLAGTAAGALSARRARVPGEGAMRALLLALGAALPLGVALARGSRRLFGGVPGAELSFGLQLATLGLCLVPAAFLAGLLFPWMARRFAAERGAGSAARAYALESAGGLAGGLLATALPALGVQNLALSLLCGAAACAAAWGPRRSRPGRAAAAAGVAAALVLLAFSPTLDRAMTRWNHPHLLDSRDTPYGRVTVTGALGQVAIFESDALAYESQTFAAEEFVHLAAAQRDRVGRVLVLGGAAQGLVPELLRLGRVTVVDVELDRGSLALVLRHLPAAERRALADPRVRVVFADPRRFLARPGPLRPRPLGAARARLGAYEPLLHARVLRRVRRAAWRPAACWPCACAAPRTCGRRR